MRARRGRDDVVGNRFLRRGRGFHPYWQGRSRRCACMLPVERRLWNGMGKCFFMGRPRCSAGANFSFKISHPDAIVRSNLSVSCPAALRPGDTVGIIAPAGPIEPDALEAGCATLLRMGYRPFYLPSILDRDLYFAGSVERRLNELHEMFKRREVRAIVCARGGYGCNYLLPHLDLGLIRRNPKIFVGCSDVTTLLTYLCDAVGLGHLPWPHGGGRFWPARWR